MGMYKLYIMRQWHEHRIHIGTGFHLVLFYICGTLYKHIYYEIQSKFTPFATPYRNEKRKKIDVFIFIYTYRIRIHQPRIENVTYGVSHHRPPFSFSILSHSCTPFDLICESRKFNPPEKCQPETEIATDKQTDMYGMVCIVMIIMKTARKSNGKTTTITITPSTTFYS